MKLTIIRDQQGQFVGAVDGHVPMQPPEKAAGGNQAGPMAHTGQSFEHITVPEDFHEIKNEPHLFVRRLKEHLARSGKDYTK